MEEKTAQFYSEAQTEQKLVQMLIFITFIKQKVWNSDASNVNQRDVCNSIAHTCIQLYTVGKKYIWSPADLVRLPTDKEMIGL